MFGNKEFNKNDAQKWAAAFEILFKIDQRINPHLYAKQFFDFELSGKPQKSLFEPLSTIVK